MFSLNRKKGKKNPTASHGGFDSFGHFLKKRIVLASKFKRFNFKYTFTNTTDKDN